MASTGEGSSSRPSSQPSRPGTAHATNVGTACAPLSPSYVLMRPGWTQEKLGFGYTANIKQLGSFGYTTACSASELVPQPAMLKGYLGSLGTKLTSRRRLCPDDLDKIEMVETNGQAAFAAWMLQKARNSPPPSRKKAAELQCFLRKDVAQQQKAAIVYDSWLQQKAGQQRKNQRHAIAAVKLQHLCQSQERLRDAQYWATALHREKQFDLRHRSSAAAARWGPAPVRPNTGGSHQHTAQAAAAHIDNVRAYRDRQMPHLGQIASVHSPPNMPKQQEPQWGKSSATEEAPAAG